MYPSQLASFCERGVLIALIVLNDWSSIAAVKYFPLPIAWLLNNLHRHMWRSWFCVINYFLKLSCPHICNFGEVVLNHSTISFYWSLLLVTGLVVHFYYYISDSRSKYLLDFETIFNSPNDMARRVGFFWSRWLLLSVHLPHQYPKTALGLFNGACDSKCCHMVRMTNQARLFWHVEP